MFFRTLFVTILALLLWLGERPCPATAATTGKIAGRVTDIQGQPLPGANVVVMGSRRGATADRDGYYTILLIQPGDHELQASLVGFQSVVKQNVRVAVGYTTTVDFRLKETALEAEEIVVVADRPPVEPDKTASKFYVTAEDIELTPVVKDVQAFAGLQPGVQHDGLSVRQGFITMSGTDGTPNDGRIIGFETNYPKPPGLIYTVDGVRMVSSDARTANTFTGVNRISVQEISVVTGVPEAEYGNMDAGIVNIVTKEGGHQYHGFAEYQYNLPGKKHFGLSAYDPRVHFDTALQESHIGNYFGNFRENPRADWFDEREDIGPDGIPGTQDDTGRLVHIQSDDYTDVSGHRMEGSISGPLTLSASFHFSAQTHLEPRQRPWPDLRTLPNVQLTGKLTFDLTPGIDVKVGGVFGRSQAFRVTQNAALSDGRDIFLPADHSGAGREITWNAMGYAVLTHALSPKALYELRVSRSDTEQDTMGVPDDTENVIRDTDNWFTIRQNVRDFRLERQTRHNVKFDFSSQLTQDNFFKAGFDATWYRSWQWEENSTGQAGKYNVWTIYDYSEAAKHRHGGDGQIDFVPIRPNTKNLPDWERGGSLDDPVWAGYRDHPRRAFQLSAYVQDKLEFEGMVINIGLRMDSFFHKGQFTAEPFWADLAPFRFFGDAEAAMARQAADPYPADPTAFPLWDGNDMFQISPRFGISHPISARSAVHFSYGRFFKVPIFYTMYGQRWTTRNLTIHEDLNGDGRLSSYEYMGGLEYTTTRGSAQVSAPTAVNYELGLDWNFVSDYTATVTAYYRRSEKDLSNNGGRGYWDPATRTLRGNTWYVNSYSGETRGLEVAIRKQFSHYFAFRASYSWYWEQNAFASYPNDLKWFPDGNFIRSGTYRTNFDIDPDTGERVWRPLTEAEINGMTVSAETQILQEIYNPQFDFRPSEKFKDQGRPGARVGLPITDEPNIAVQAWNTFVGLARGPEDKRDAPSEGSLTVQFSTPPGFGPTVNGWRPLGDLNVNVVVRMKPGTFFLYTIPFPAPATNDQVIPKNLIFSRTPTAFRTDLGIQKRFKVGAFRPEVFFETTNLFNGKEPRPKQWNTAFPDGPAYGLAPNQPDPKRKREQGVAWDEWESYRNRTREIFFGIRLSM